MPLLCNRLRAVVRRCYLAVSICEKYLPSSRYKGGKWRIASLKWSGQRPHPGWLVVWPWLAHHPARLWSTRSNQWTHLLPWTVQVNVTRSKVFQVGASLVAQWLRVHLLVWGDMGSIPGWGTRIPHALVPLSMCTTRERILWAIEKTQTKQKVFQVNVRCPKPGTTIMSAVRF